MQKIVTFLTFKDRAEEAAKLYTSVLGGRIVSTSHYGEAGPHPKGQVATVAFEIAGQTFVALNGGSQFRFSEGISLSVQCETQAEIDELWEKLSAGGGEKGPCGWLKDRFGVSWQITPAIMPQLIADNDPARRDRVMTAMMQMTKLDIKKLKEAAAK